MVTQADSKVLIGGIFNDIDGIARTGIARLNVNGSLDTSFDSGIMTGILVEDLAVQPDGKVLIGGGFTQINGTARNKIARLHANGSLDTSFDPGTGASHGVRTLALQPDGKVLIGGNFNRVNGVDRMLIARLNADGSLDTSFDPGGWVVETDWVSALALQPDGKVLVGGYFTLTNSLAYRDIVRLNADGSLDTTFDPGTGANNWVGSLALQPDGKVLVGGGFTEINGVSRGNIARLNANGSLDTSFDTSTGASHGVRALVLQPDGKVLIGGDFIRVNGVDRMLVARLNVGGSLDTSFDPGEWAVKTDAVLALALQVDRLLVGGRFTLVNDVVYNNIVRMIVGDAYEPDNTYTQANVIQNGISQTHSIVPATDVDWVKFSLVETSDVILETVGVSGDTRMWLYDNSLNQIAYDDDGGINLFSKITESSLAAGTYYVKVDSYLNAAEITSYTLSAVFSTTSTYPDLVVQYPDVSDSTLTPGQSFFASATVRNQGTANSSGTILRYYRSTNSTISISDTQIATDYVNILAPGGTSLQSASVTAPTETGTYWIGACVDVVSGESDTGNNCSYGVQVVVSTQSYTLSVSKTGSGTVSSTPPGIKCGSDCSQSYVQDTLVTLTATADSSWLFSHWGGACSGAGSCEVSMTAAKSVSATFTHTPQDAGSQFILSYFITKQSTPVQPPAHSYSLLNDTGITWGGNYPDGNNATCTSNISGPQDCQDGRDATHNDDSDGHAGFSYTKISSTGAELPADATVWSCVKDNVTGLTWEVKTDDGGIHDQDNNYRWGGKTHLGSGYGTYYVDWDTLVDGSNTESLCGFSDWRVSNIMELVNLANRDRAIPAIDTDYFPYTHASSYWSASPTAYSFNSAWFFNFHDGYSASLNRYQNLLVRLVRGGE